MEHWFEVTSPGNRTLFIKAINNNQAKRKACKEWGFKSSDPWVGISNLKARKVREEDLPWNQGGQANV